VTQVSNQTYAYDANGTLRVTSRNGQTLQYDAENRLTQVISGTVPTQYVYNADGTRVKKTVGGVSTYYVGNYYEITISPQDPPLVTKYYYFGGQRVAMRTSAGVTYLHGDHLGSTSVASTSSGALASRQTYYAFGAPRTSEGTLPTDYTYTGQKFDNSSNLMYYNARYYDATIGRFIQPDSIIPNVYNPQDLNRYAYVHNNPVRYTDPSGHFVFVPLLIMAIGGVINAGVDYYVTTQVNHQDYSVERGAAMFTVGAVATGVAMVAAPLAATGVTAVATTLGADAVVSTAAGVVTAGTVTGVINVGTGAANTAVDSLANGSSTGETLQNVAKYANSDSVGRDFALGFVSGGSGQVLQKLLTPAAQTVNIIKRANPAPFVTRMPRGGLAPRISGTSQIVANALSDVPYFVPALDNETTENNLPTVTQVPD